MAKLSNPLMSMTATGTLGDHLSYVQNGITAVARSLSRRRALRRAGIKLPPSAAQQAIRDRWTNGIAAWRSMSKQEQAAYSEAANAFAITGFNLFMREFNTAPPQSPIPVVTASGAAAYADDTWSLPVVIDTTNSTKLLALLLTQSTGTPEISDPMGNTWEPLIAPPNTWHNYSPYPAYATWMQTTDATVTTSQTHSLTAHVVGGWPTMFVVGIAPEQGGNLSITGGTFGQTTTSPFQTTIANVQNALVIAGLASYWETQPVPYQWVSPITPLSDIHTYGVWQGATGYAEIVGIEDVLISATTEQTNFQAATSGIVITEQL